MTPDIRAGLGEMIDAEIRAQLGIAAPSSPAGAAASVMEALTDFHAGMDAGEVGLFVELREHLPDVDERRLLAAAEATMESERGRHEVARRLLGAVLPAAFALPDVESRTARVGRLLEAERDRVGACGAGRLEESLTHLVAGGGGGRRIRRYDPDGPGRVLTAAELVDLVAR